MIFYCIVSPEYRRNTPYHFNQVKQTKIPKQTFLFQCMINNTLFRVCYVLVYITHISTFFYHSFSIIIKSSNKRWHNQSRVTSKWPIEKNVKIISVILYKLIRRDWTGGWTHGLHVLVRPIYVHLYPFISFSLLFLFSLRYESLWKQEWVPSR